MNDMRQRIVEMIAGQLGLEPAGIQDDMALGELGDSLDYVEVVMESEDEFEITIPDAWTGKIKTIGDLIDLVRRLSDEERAAPA